jgi:UDP-glucose 4-epimerase
LKQGSNILVTGGTGYIGSHTVVELLEKGFRVVVGDNLSNSSEEVVEAIRKISSRDFVFEEVDFCDAAATEALFAKHSIDAVIHFAAYKAVGESVEKPLMYYRNNLLSLVNLLETSVRHGVRDFVFSSSCSVYGEPDSIPVHEAMPVKKAESPYANTKQIGEEILHDTAKAHPIRVIALRYFNPAGSHPSALIGEYPSGPPNNLVPVITQVAAGRRDRLSVFGSDYDTPDGTCIRDYIHVVDVARAHIHAVERLLQDRIKSRFEIFNLGTGKGSTVLEVIRTFEQVTGLKLDYQIAGRRPGDVEKVYADTSYANAELGWKAEYSLAQMLRSAWQWELTLSNKNNGN